MSTLAKIERERISERTKSGLRRAVAEGKTIGRPPVSPQLKERALSLLKEKNSFEKVARMVGVSPAAVWKWAQNPINKRGV
jgi:putative DNA-invertase from lambdoid prophage Rac